ncbi:hypothetical protein PG997_007482 [Apiospora hydei]|uniref:Uncharacterized protein n=1 Tax=Apiospora hydei TaxID=1337664 RepID=A0ABR1W854_9PEZI
MSTGLFRCDTAPEKKQAKLYVTLSASLTLSLTVTVASARDERRANSPLKVCVEPETNEEATEMARVKRRFIPPPPPSPRS